MTFKPHDEVTVSIPQLHNRSSIIERGEIISVQGNAAQVMLKDEDVPRTIPLNRLQRVDSVFGSEFSDRPNEMPVINAIR